jgi:hypothetical protein
MIMCQDLNEYDPFETLVICGYYDECCYVDSEPMSDYDWEEWLEVEG